ncbi:MAG: peptidylprolyl isomerase [Oscillospiraceae bacterium]
MNLKRILMSAALSVGVLLSAAGCSGGTASSSGNVEDITFADGDKIAVIEIKDYGTVKAKLFPDIAPVGVENFVQLAENGYYNGLKIHRVVTDGIIQGGSLNGDGTGGVAAFTGEDTKDDTKAASFPIEVSEKARHFYGALCYAADNYGNCAAQFYIVNCKTPQDITKIDAAKVQAKADELAAAAAEATWEADSSAAKNNSYLQTYYSNHASILGSKDQAAVDKYAKDGGVYQFDGMDTVFGQVFEGFSVIDEISKVDVETNAHGEKSMPVKDIIISSVKIETYKASTAEATAEADSGKSSKTESKPENTAQSTAEAGTSASQTDEAPSTLDTKETA